MEEEHRGRRGGHGKGAAGAARAARGPRLPRRVAATVTRGARARAGQGRHGHPGPASAAAGLAAAPRPAGLRPLVERRSPEARGDTAGLVILRPLPSLAVVLAPADAV